MSTDSNELNTVEKPFIAQLKSLGWSHLSGSTGVPSLTERESFAQTLLTERIKKALVKLNPWMGESQVRQAIHAIERLPGTKLMERNQAAMTLLVKGVPVDVDPREHGIQTKTAKIIDFEDVSANDLLVIDQFRVDIPGTRSYCVPDLVLFVNGIPIVVVECKSPAETNPMEKAIVDLLKYSNQRDGDEPEGVEELFDFNLFMVATTFYEARAGSVGARPKHYMEWKDTSPIPMSEHAEKLGVERLSSQQMLVAGMLYPERLVDLLHNFVLFDDDAGQTIKIIARYQQYRAVHEALLRLQTKPTRVPNVEDDQRGGIIWHTQGSGKSLTMVFLIRKMRTIPKLRSFKIVVLTDRRSLHRQLSTTALLTGENVNVPKKMDDIPVILKREGKDLVFTLIQRMQVLAPGSTADEDCEEDLEAEVEKVATDESGTLPEILNESTEILLLVDEAHRSHGNTMHANLMAALPNCAKIGFTGTPIMEKSKVLTEKIFGGFIDIYSIKQSQDDGATRPIRYEGWSVEGEIRDDKTIDEIFDEAFREMSEEEREAVKEKYVTKSAIRDASEMIREHARHVVRDFVANVLPGGFKAQLIATSRRGAIRYQEALEEEFSRLLDQIDAMDPALRKATDQQLESLPESDRFLIRASRHLELLDAIEIAAVVSPTKEDPAGWSKWTSLQAQDQNVARFKKPMRHKDRQKQDGLSIICVKSMLLTGFDAPINQTLYIDRFLQGHELLQAIARVNRNYGAKRVGRVVDFFGVAWHLGDALRVYSVKDRKDIAKGLLTIRDDLHKLDECYKKTLQVFYGNKILDITNTEACVHLLRNEKIRAEFVTLLKEFLSILNSLRFRSEARQYLADAKQLGFIQKSAANLYREDNRLVLADCGEQVRELIDSYLRTRGIAREIEPVDILHADFEKQVDNQPSDRSKAAAMEHAAKSHISKKMDEDPVLYEQFSQRIRKILNDFAENWVQQKEAFLECIRDMRSCENESVAGLAPHTQVPFFRTILKHAGLESKELTADQSKKLSAVTVEILDHARNEIRAAGFWQHPNKPEVLRAWIFNFLDDHDVLDYDKIAKLADDLVAQIKSKHSVLV
jgi:type I restriction enzyme R subunit